MGEAGKDALWVGFDRAIKLEFHGAKSKSPGIMVCRAEYEREYDLRDEGR